MSWISYRKFQKYADGLYQYSTVDRRKAEDFAKAMGGEVWTEHSGEGNSSWYSRGHSNVDAMGCIVLVKEAIPSAEEYPKWGVSRLFHCKRLNKIPPGIRLGWLVTVGPHSYQVHAKDAGEARAIVERKVGPLKGDVEVCQCEV